MHTKDADGAPETLETIDDWMQPLRISRRGVDRMLAAGKIPPLDLRIGRLLRWKNGSVARWIDAQAEKVEG